MPILKKWIFKSEFVANTQFLLFTIKILKILWCKYGLNHLFLNVQLISDKVFVRKEFQLISKKNANWLNTMTLASKTLNSYMFSEIFPNFISVLDWEPSAAKVTKSYSHRLPALERFYLGTTFSLLKLTHSI